MNKISITFTLPTSAKPEQIWSYYTKLSLRQLWETDLEYFVSLVNLKQAYKEYLNSRM